MEPTQIQRKAMNWAVDSRQWGGASPIASTVRCQSHAVNPCFLVHVSTESSNSSSRTQSPMFLDPENLQRVPPSEILKEATAGRLGIDQRFFRALLNRREETLAALLDWAKRDREDDPVNLEIEAVELIYAFRAPEGMPFLLDAIRIAPDEIPDEVIEAIHSFGRRRSSPCLICIRNSGRKMAPK